MDLKEVAQFYYRRYCGHLENNKRVIKQNRPIHQISLGYLARPVPPSWTWRCVDRLPPVQRLIPQTAGLWTWHHIQLRGKHQHALAYPALRLPQRNSVLTCTHAGKVGLILRDLLHSSKHQCDLIQQVTFTFTEQFKTPWICKTTVQMIRCRKIYWVPKSAHPTSKQFFGFIFSFTEGHTSSLSHEKLYKNVPMRWFRGRPQGLEKHSGKAKPGRPVRQQQGLFTHGTQLFGQKLYTH